MWYGRTWDFIKKSQKFCYINSKYWKKKNIWKIVLWRIISLCGIAHDEAIFVPFEFVLAKCRGCQHQICVCVCVWGGGGGGGGWGGRFRWELLIYKCILYYKYVCACAWASCQIRKIAGCACAGNAWNVFPRRRLQMKPLVSNPGVHHGSCVTHVPWCMSGSLTRGGGENVPGIPGARRSEL